MYKIVISILFLSAYGFSQNEPIITDRPDVTESAVTVPLKTLQIETGFTYQKNSEPVNGIDTGIKLFNFAGTLLRYGIFSFMELRAGAEYLLLEAETDGQSENIQGISGVFAGAKIQLMKDHAKLPDAALFVHFNLPAGHKIFRPGKTEPEILLAASHIIVEQFSASYNLGGTWDTEDEIIHYFYSSSIGIGLSEKTSIYAELFGEVSSAFSASYNLGAGLTYLLLDNLQLDISSGFNFDKPGVNWFIGSGFSIRIPQ